MEKSKAETGREEAGARQENKKKEKKSSFWKYFLLYYGLMMALYLYFMLGNLSMAPKFVYTQF